MTPVQVNRAGTHGEGAGSDPSIASACSLGTYALVLRNRQAGSICVGAFGIMRVDPGIYVYVGSAFGPGGLRARLSRHASRRKVKRWHIDYLRPRTSLVGAWFSTASNQLEHDWAVRIGALPTVTIPLLRFGASDCSCDSHLFLFPDSDASGKSIRYAVTEMSGNAFGELGASALRRLARRNR
jgi:Uri superfamily endonuclease